ncbi:adenine phosphoribosyltransferase [Aureococcus anophagefferens]|nr:adenine phosphoribosyltransferase [Aureococcus anophagefferens]
MGMMQSTPCTPGTSRADYTQDGPVAQRIASVTPYFPFKGIDRFYDIGGFLKDPEAFALVVEVLVERYRDADIDSVCGLYARGFVLGPPLALALKKPFFMLRKKGKMPNAVTGAAYAKEYAGNDALSIPRGAVKAGDKVLVVDDLVATGGTLLAALDLIAKFDGVVPECVVEIKFLDARAAFAKRGFGHVPIWALMSEDILTKNGLEDADIPTDGDVDDGEAH